MDGVEREFEKRDANIYDLEGQVKIEKSKVESLEAELQKASRIIESQKGELGAARNMQKTLVEQCEHVEGKKVQYFTDHSCFTKGVHVMCGQFRGVSQTELLANFKNVNKLL